MFQLLKLSPPLRDGRNDLPSRSRRSRCVERQALPAWGSTVPTHQHVRSPLEPLLQPILKFHTKPDKSATRQRRHAFWTLSCSLAFPLHPSALTWTIRNRVTSLSHL